MKDLDVQTLLRVTTIQKPSMMMVLVTLIVLVVWMKLLVTMMLQPHRMTGRV